MAIPVHLQQFKAAGVYRVVFDKSTMTNVDTQILRLVVGYSEKGPFNIPVYINNSAEFIEIFGNISKKLEKRGIYFHRLALQMLTVGPILCLNLKKFDGETVLGSTISSEFNPKFTPIDTVELNIEDIYDTTRFWELNAENLNDLQAVNGQKLDQYINICTTNVKDTSATYFIRKASGSSVSSYNITVDTWYSDKQDEMPEYLYNKKQNHISDFFAEIYVFNGKFDARQVLTSETLKNYFDVVKNGDEDVVILKPVIYNSFNEPIDTLDALYNDGNSNALGHYVGALIPNFKNKQGAYASLDILFNNDQSVHNMMMSFNTDLLDDNIAHIDLSGYDNIPLKESNGLSLEKIYKGEAKTTLLGNNNSPVIANKLNFKSSVINTNGEAYKKYNDSKTKINGSLYVSKVEETSITLKQIGKDKDKEIKISGDKKAEVLEMAKKLGVTFNDETPVGGTYFSEDSGSPFVDESNPLNGPKQIIVDISRISLQSEGIYVDPENDLKATLLDVETDQYSTNLNTADNVYDPSITFVPFNTTNWSYDENFYHNGLTLKALKSDTEFDNSIIVSLQKGDALLAEDGVLDINGDTLVNADDKDGYYDTVYVQETGTKYDESGKFVCHYAIVSAKPIMSFTIDTDKTIDCLVRLDNPLNQEIGTIYPTYLEGYTYKNDKPAGTDMLSKVNWMNFILSTLTEYKGLRTALLNKSEIDYRYIIDTFESFPVSGLKSVLSYLAKEKQSAFCISNFPSVQSFVKCPYTSFTNENGIFDVKYVVAGYNSKKAASQLFTLPSDAEGASFVAFYTPVKFTDGYLDKIVPSAGLVSNLFIEKYISRKPYYIVAGPNYGSITASGMVGPDYKYSMDELQILEPFGVNALVYRPNFGTFINANQTAKQTPLSALSRVNVRELVIYLQDEIEKVLQAFQWEFNNQRTRDAILSKADTICNSVMLNGGLQVFKNVMDESNNTAEIIDNEMAVLSTYIEPGFGCGKMVHELTIYRTGQLSSSISE